MKKMVEALQGRKRAVVSHTHKLGRPDRLTLSQNTQRDTLSACIVHHTHIKRGSYHDINGPWLESISQKTSETNRNHISDLVALQKEGKGRAAWWNPFSAENKQEIFHLYYFIQRGREESLPTMRKDGNTKWVVPQERPGPSKLQKTKWATGFRVLPWPITTCTTAERGKIHTAHIHQDTYIYRSVLHKHTHTHTVK